MFCLHEIWKNWIVKKSRFLEQEKKFEWIELIILILLSKIIWNFNFKSTIFNSFFRSNFWKKPLIFCVTVAKLSCALTCLPITCEKTTSQWFLKTIKRIWSRPQKSYLNISSVILRRKILLTSSRKCRINTGNESYFSCDRRHCYINLWHEFVITVCYMDYIY